MVEQSTSLLVALVCVVLQDPAPAPGSAQDPDPVLVTVHDRAVRLSDLMDEVNRQIPLNFYHRRVPAERMSAFRREAFDLLVNKHLIHLDALDTGLKATRDELRAEFERALRDAGEAYTKLEPKAKDALYEEVLTTLTRRTLITKREQQIAAAVPEVSEKMVRELYDQRIKADDSAFQSPKEAHFFHIFVAVDPSRIRSEEAVKRAKIEAALAELEKGKPFAEVARIYSEDEFAEQGGDLGYQQSGSFRMRAVHDEAFALEKGKTSSVIRSLHGFHILHCVDIKPPHRLSFEEMRGAMEEWLRAEHLKLARERWLAQLRQKYRVTLLRPELLDAPADAPTGDVDPRPVAKPAGNPDK